MTTEKAIKEINSRIELSNRDYPDLVKEYIQALELAVEALRKQEQVKPKYDHVEGKCCPNCFERATFQTWKHGYPVVIKMNYCPNCGQKLDWED